MKTTTISARIDSETKEKVERIFEKLGLTASQAIALFYKQVEQQRGLPFPADLPNETTQKALEEAEDQERLLRFDTTDDFYADLGI